jgi:hypothetical protein
MGWRREGTEPSAQGLVEGDRHHRHKGQGLAEKMVFCFEIVT